MNKIRAFLIKLWPPTLATKSPSDLCQQTVGLLSEHAGMAHSITVARAAESFCEMCHFYTKTAVFFPHRGSIAWKFFLCPLQHYNVHTEYFPAHFCLSPSNLCNSPSVLLLGALASSSPPSLFNLPTPPPCSTPCDLIKWELYE